MWTGIDYLGEAAGWPIHGSGAGLLTLAGFEKIGYYRRKSLWADAPNLYLMTARFDADVSEEFSPMYRNWQYIPDELIEVRCYTNLTEATLYCNGQSVGIGIKDSSKEYICWKIPFVVGKITAVGLLKTNDTTSCIEDTLETEFAPCILKLHVWQPADQYISAINSISLDPTLLQIEVSITDCLDNLCTSDQTLLHVCVEGNGKLMGIENGDLADVTDYSASYRRAYEGRLLIYVKKLTPDAPLVINVKGRNLKSASISV